MAKRSGAKVKPAVAPAEKPSIGLPDPLEAARAEAVAAKEGNLKLQNAIDIMRTTLESIVKMEWDHAEGRPVTAEELRKAAIQGLNQYSTHTGQNWRRAKLIGDRSGDRSLNFEG
jgi:hypothetical protein